MMEVVFQSFVNYGYMIKIENTIYDIGKLLLFCKLPTNWLKNCKNISSMASILKI